MIPRNRILAAILAAFLAAPAPACSRSCSSHPAGPTAAQIAEGEKLFETVGCTSCHMLGGLGGDRAPALDGVASRYTAHEGSPEAAALFFRNHVRDPESYPGFQKEKYRELAMPKIKFSEEELDRLVDFLMTLR